MEENPLNSRLTNENSVPNYGAVHNSENRSLIDEHLQLLRSHRNTVTRYRPRWMSFLGIFLTVLTSSQMALSLLIAKRLAKFHPFMISFWEFSGNLCILPVVIYHQFWRRDEIFSELYPPHKAEKWLNVLLLVLQCVSWSCAGMLEFYAVQYISVADSSVIVYTCPVFVTIISHILLGETLGFFPLLYGFIAVLGVVVIARPPILTGCVIYNSNTLIGCAMATGTLILCISSFVCLRRLRNVHYSVVTLCVAVWGVLQTTALASSVGRFEFPREFHDWLLVGALILLSITPQICITLAFKFEEAGTVTLFRSFDILFAFLWQYVFMGVVPDWVSILGGGIVFLGVFLASLRKVVTEFPEDHQLRKWLCFVLS